MTSKTLITSSGSTLFAKEPTPAPAKGREVRWEGGREGGRDRWKKEFGKPLRLDNGRKGGRGREGEM
jgi:hypothetical protein